MAFEPIDISGVHIISLNMTSSLFSYTEYNQ